MKSEEIFEQLRGRLPEAGLSYVDAAPQPWVELPAGSLIEAGIFLRDEPALACDCLDCLTGIDLPEEQAILMVYHLYSYRHRHLFVLKTRTPRETPEVPSLSAVWPAADWYERETYDLLGVRFAGHPNLTRLFLPEEWPGHPFRKDWVEPPEILGIPTTRPDPLAARPGGAGAAPAEPGGRSAAGGGGDA
jgi:NADH-quinone oxidoreductase subunit C